MRQRAGHKSFACPSYFRPSTSASARITACLIWRSRFPDPRPNACRSQPASTAWCWSLPCSRSALPASITTPPLSLIPTARSSGSTARCTSPTIPGYYEKFYFTPGDLGFRSFDTHVGRIGTLVCWDQWYPEGARLTALQGAVILFYPTAIGWHPRREAEFGEAQHDAWRTMQRAHAIANGVYVAAVNRVGFEHGNVRGNKVAGPGLEFWGGSFIADPFGVLARAPHDKEEIVTGRGRPPAWRTFAAAGHSSATAASTDTPPSTSDLTETE